jgi:hypothetical protein
MTDDEGKIRITDVAFQPFAASLNIADEELLEAGEGLER